MAASPIALHAELRHPDDTVELVAGVHTSALHMLGRDIGANAPILGLSARIEGHRPLAEQLDALDVERPFWLRGWVRPLMRARTWFEGHIGPVYGSCAIRHRGRPHIVSAGADATVRVWDPLHPDAEIARFVGHRGAVRDVQTLPTSDEAHDLVVSASDDGTACVWDPSSPDAPLVVFRKHQGAVRCAAILPWIEVPHAVATGSANGTVRIWDPATSEELQEFSSGNSAINDLLVIGWPTPPHIAITAATDEGVVVWDPLTPRRLARPFSPFSAKGGRSPGSTVGALAFAGFDRGSPLIAYGKSDREIVVWNPVRQRKVSHYLGHSAGIVDMSAVEWPDFDRPLVLTTSEDGVRVWDPLNPSLTIKRIEPGNASIGRGYNLPGLETPTVVTATTDGRVQVWGADVLDEQDALAAPPGWLWEVVSLEGPDAASLRVAVATTDNRAVILDLSSVQPREVRSLTGHTDTVVGLATVGSRAGATLLVTTSDDATARVWDLERDLPEVRRYEGHEDKVWGAAALRLPHHRGTSVATTSADQTIRIWLPLTGETIAVLRGHRAGVWRVRSGPWPGLPHEVLVSTSADETARVWDPLEPNDPIAVLRGHAHVVVDAAFVPVDGWPGGVLVTTSDDKTAIIWDPTNGDRLGTLVGHDGPVSGVAALYWPPLGRHVIITTSEDSTLRGWDPGAGWKEMLRIPLVAPGHAILPLQRAHVAVTTSRAGTRGVLPVRQEGRAVSFTLRIPYRSAAHVDLAAELEWLATSGTGAYAMGTACLLRTRRYHGLLVAPDPVTGIRHLALGSLDPVLILGAEAVHLATHQWRDGSIWPTGHRLISSFTVDDGLPQWRWRIGDVVFERTLALLPGQSAVGIVDRLVAAPRAVEVHWRPLVTWREAAGYRGPDSDMRLETHGDGFVLESRVYVRGGGFKPKGEWTTDLCLRQEADRGLPDSDALLSPGRFEATLEPGDRQGFVAAAGNLPDADACEILEAARRDTAAVLAAARVSDEIDALLVHAADQFVVRQPNIDVIAGFPWFGSWTRHPYGLRGALPDNHEVGRGRASS